MRTTCISFEDVQKSYPQLQLLVMAELERLLKAGFQVRCKNGRMGRTWDSLEEFDEVRRARIEKPKEYDLWADLSSLKADITFGQF